MGLSALGYAPPAGLTPTSLADAVRTAADRELMTVSEYIRRTLIDRLRQEGLDPAGKLPAACAPHAEAAA
jgi:hypothetical protein